MNRAGADAGGGLRGVLLSPWFFWSLGALAFVYAFFHRVAPSVMIDPIMAEMGVSGGVLGNLSAFYFYAYAALQIPVGLMVDRWGVRRTLAAALLVSALGSLLFALSDSLGALYLGRLMIGAGAAFGFVGTLKLATDWFPAERFALMAGLTMMAGMLGGILGQAPQAALVEAVGWRSTVAATGGLGLVLAGLALVFLRDRPRAAGEDARQSPSLASALSGLGSVLRERQNWLAALVGAAMTAPMLAFAGLWGVAWLMQVHGYERPDAAGMTSLLLIGWACGSPLAGWLSDRLRRRKPLLIGGCLLALAAFLSLLYLPLGAAAMAFVLFLSGLGMGAMIVCYSVVAESNRLGIVGTAYACVNMAVTGTGAIFQPAIGLLLDLGWTGERLGGARLYSAAAYDGALWILPAFLLTGLVGALALRETRGIRPGA